MSGRPTTLVIGCGALAREIQAIKSLNGWEHLSLTCLDAELHNRPERIAGRLREKILQHRNDFEKILVAYADCGTGGAIDKVLNEFGIGRLPGPHCYATYAGGREFLELAEREPGTFYLTDFLVRHFQRLVVQGLKLDVYPHLKALFFGHYTRCLYLVQQDDEKLQRMARQAADFLGLDFSMRMTGFGELASWLQEKAGR